MTSLLADRRVLVVEDEMLVLMIMEDMLADLGCESVTAAATVAQALALIEANSFDVAMLDMNLGGDRSYPVADALAARGVPFAFATGYGGHTLDGYGERPMLKKPFQFADLLSTLTGLLPLTLRPPTLAIPPNALPGSTEPADRSPDLARPAE